MPLPAQRETQAFGGLLTGSFVIFSVVLGLWIAGLSFAGLAWALDVAGRRRRLLLFC